MNGINSELQSSKIWGKLEVLRQQREMIGKVVKRKLQGTKCVKQPLHDLYHEQTKNKKEFAMGPMITTDESKSKVEVFKYVPLYNISAISKLSRMKSMRNDITKSTKNVYFKH